MNGVGRCSLCSVLGKLGKRRFYSDEENRPFVIIENFKTLTPILIFKEHIENLSSLSVLLDAFSEMNLICFRLFEKMYSLRVDQTRGHFSILCVRL